MLPVNKLIGAVRRGEIRWLNYLLASVLALGSDAAHVISSAPMRELAARIHPLPACALNAAPSLRYRDFLTVALKIR